MRYMSTTVYGIERIDVSSAPAARGGMLPRDLMWLCLRGGDAEVVIAIESPAQLDMISLAAKAARDDWGHDVPIREIAMSPLDGPVMTSTKQSKKQSKKENTR